MTPTERAAVAAAIAALEPLEKAIAEARTNDHLAIRFVGDEYYGVVEKAFASLRALASAPSEAPKPPGQEPGETELRVARAVNKARYDTDAIRAAGTPSYIAKTFDQEDKQTREYVMRIARAAIETIASTPSETNDRHDAAIDMAYRDGANMAINAMLEGVSPNRPDRVPTLDMIAEQLRDSIAERSKGALTAALGLIGEGK